MKSFSLCLLLLATFCSCLCAPGFAAAEKDGPRAVRIVDATALSNMEAQTGGLIPTPISGPSLCVLNTQSRVPQAVIQETTEKVQKLFRFPCTCASRATGKDPVADAVRTLEDKSVAVVIVVCDVPGQPALLVAPENRWAVVNVAALNGLMVSKEKLSERVEKETWRAVGYVMGAANSAMDHCLLKPVFSTADLDALTGRSLSPEPLGKMLLQAKKLGMTAVRMTTYRKAVEAGWAPAPTNDFQRVIWQELHK